MIKKIYLSIILSIILIFSSVCFSCSSQPKYDQSAVFGMGDVFMGTYNDLDDISKRIGLMKDLGIKSHRFWIRSGSSGKNECFFSIKNNELVINQDYVTKSKEVVRMLKEAGINHITFDICWMYGKKADGSYKYYGGDCPSIGSPDYISFMESVKYQFSVIVKTYQEINYFEIGNEMNYNFLSIDGKNLCSSEDKAKVITDFSYFAMQGIKEGNPNAKGVLNGLAEVTYKYNEALGVYEEIFCGTESIAESLDLIYKGIESGEYPTILDKKSKKIDDYFDILAWHPYSARTSDDWISFNNDIYEVVKNHKDNGRPVFITEFGLAHDTESSGQNMVEIFKNIDKTPYIEAVHIFILSDANWSEGTFSLTTKNEDGSYSVGITYSLLKNEFGSK